MHSHTSGLPQPVSGEGKFFRMTTYYFMLFVSYVYYLFKEVADVWVGRQHNDLRSVGGGVILSSDYGRS